MADEYEEIQRLRELWTRSMITWGQISIPLGAGISALFISQFPIFKKLGWGAQFLLIGVGLFSIIMIHWRLIAHRIDNQIVNFYPRMLELEKENGFEAHATYYFENLSERAKNYLAHRLGIDCKKFRKNYKFRDFKKAIHEKKLREKPIDLLLKVWDDYHKDSVGTRGHKMQDFTVGLIIVSSLVGILVGHIMGFFKI